MKSKNTLLLLALLCAGNLFSQKKQYAPPAEFFSKVQELLPKKNEVYASKYHDAFYSPYKVLSQIFTENEISITVKNEYGENMWVDTLDWSKISNITIEEVRCIDKKCKNTSALTFWEEGYNFKSRIFFHKKYSEKMRAIISPYLKN
jgi:hypothetical protein